MAVVNMDIPPRTRGLDSTDLSESDHTKNREGIHLRRSIKKPVALASALLLLMISIAPAAAVIEAEEAFYNTWARTDLPVQTGMVDRTWMWGPGPNTEVLSEEYTEHPIGLRPVQYFDKARMEVNNPNIEYDGLWYVTNGLLVVELMSGMMQVGHADFVERDPAHIHIAGDPDQPDTPTYATYATLTDTPAFAEGATIAATVDVEGNVGLNNDLAVHGVTAGPMAPDTGHRTASVFWEFMNSSGFIWDWETNETTTGLLFENPYYATGLPITEAYWAFIVVDGTQKWVLTQAFERRVLTFTPDNEPGWQVEAGNVGQHYYQWRYEMVEPPPPPPPPPPETAHFHVLLGALNNSGVSGSGLLTLEDGTLHVMIEATGLEPNRTHPHHIHGFEDFQQSLCPTPDMAGEDGLIEFADGLPAYGPVALNLAPPSEVGEDGTLSYNQSFDLAEEELENWNIETLVSHTIILHGMTVGDEYEMGLPVACGSIIPDVGFVSMLTDVELPDVESEGSGFATFHFPADPMALAFNLVVNNLDDVTMAHIHLKVDGTEFGPPVLWLFGPEEAPGVASDGVLNSGIVGDLDLVGPLEGQPMSALIDAMIAGETYVNIHTSTYPGGEIRGDIERAMDHFDNGHDHNGQNDQNGEGDQNGPNDDPDVMY